MEKLSVNRPEAITIAYNFAQGVRILPGGNAIEISLWLSTFRGSYPTFPLNPKESKSVQFLFLNENDFEVELGYFINDRVIIILQILLDVVIFCIMNLRMYFRARTHTYTYTQHTDTHIGTYARRWQQFHVPPAMPAMLRTPLRRIMKNEL